MKTGLVWSDGEEITAEDFVFTVNTVMDLELGSNWASAVDPAFVDRVEALDSHLLKIFFKATDDEGNPQTPGLSVWQFGLGFMPILPEHYWASVVEEAKQAGDGAQQIEALFAHVPEGEPTAGGFTFDKWEPGAFFENETSTNFFNKGTTRHPLRKRRHYRIQRAAWIRGRVLRRAARAKSSWSTRSALTSTPSYSASMATRTPPYSR